MLVVLVIWLLTVLLCWALGAAAVRLLRLAIAPGPGLRILLGLGMATALLSLLVLVAPLWPWGPVLLLALSTGAWAWPSLALREQWQADRAKWRALPRGLKWATGLLVLILAGYSIYEPSHYDEGLYYAPYLRWMQEYGLVIGLAHIEPRMAFGSSWHLVQAALNFSPLVTVPHNELNGAVGAIMAARAVAALGHWWQGEHSAATGWVAAGLVPIALVPEWYNSVPPDFGVLAVTWLLFEIILRRDLIHRDRLLLSVAAAAWAVSIKLSALPLLIVPGLLWLQRPRLASLAPAIGLAALFVLPIIVRSLIGSGYLLFPLSATRLELAWSAPVAVSDYLQLAVQHYAIDPNAPLGAFQGLWPRQGLDAWWAFLRPSERALVSAAGLALLLLPLLLWRVARRARLHWGPLALGLGVSLAFWWLTAPALRFALAPLLGVIAAAVLLVTGRIRAVGVQRGLVLSVVAFVAYYLLSGWGNFRGQLLVQTLYPSVPLNEQQHQGVTWRQSATNDQCWHAPLPCAGRGVPLPQPRGPRLGAGFEPPTPRNR